MKFVENEKVPRSNESSPYNLDGHYTGLPSDQKVRMIKTLEKQAAKYLYNDEKLTKNKNVVPIIKFSDKHMQLRKPNRRN